MENNHEAEIDEAHKEIGSANSRISDHEYEISILEGKIERLKAEKEVIKTQKQETLVEKYKINMTHTNISEWKGSNKDIYQTVVDSNLKSGYESYYGNVDTALDEINDAITRLENEKYELQGSIGWLRSQINSLYNCIRNWVN